MKLVLTPRLQRVVALGILLLIVVVLLNAIAWPLWASWSLHAERVDMLKRQALTMEGLAAAAPRYEAVAKKLAANPDAKLLTFAAPQPTLAVAQLQGQLSPNSRFFRNNERAANRIGFRIAERLGEEFMYPIHGFEDE